MTRALGSATGTSRTPTIDELAELRRRIRHGQTLLETYDGDARWDAVEARVRSIQDEYRHAMYLYRQTVTTSEIEERIHKGVAVLNRYWDADDSDAFDRALLRYEVLVEVNWSADVLHGWLDSQLRVLRAHRVTAREKGRIPA